jgi:hypothetical protein
MPVNPDSRLRRTRTAVHGWTEGGKFFTSLQPRASNAPKNDHATATEALREASRRSLSIIWDDPTEIR